MTGDRPPRRIAPAPAFADRTRYAAALAAATDPNGVMDMATEQFRDMARSAAAGDRPAMLAAADGVAEGCLRLCAAPAASPAAAENKARFLAVMAKWAWPRRPAVAAILDTAREAERRAWGGDVDGVA